MLTANFELPKSDAGEALQILNSPSNKFSNQKVADGISARRVRALINVNFITYLKTK